MIPPPSFEYQTGAVRVRAHDLLPRLPLVTQGRPMALRNQLRGKFWVGVVLCGVGLGGCSGSSSGPVPPPPPPPPPPPATKLAFTGQPSSAVAGAANTPAVQVAVQDAQGNTVTSATTNVTVAIGTNPASGALSGTMTVAAVS